MILDLIEKNKNITQREIANEIGVAVSLVNNYLDDYESKGFIKRKRYSTKTVEYFCTKKGTERRKILNIWYLKSSQEVYVSAKNNISVFLNQLVKKGFREIFLYGAGEVAEIILDVINNDQSIKLGIVAIIDDDLTKMDSYLINTKIVDVSYLEKYYHDGILISSYTHHDVIQNRLLELQYNKKKILHFFN